MDKHTQQASRPNCKQRWAALLYQGLNIRWISVSAQILGSESYRPITPPPPPICGHGIAFARENVVVSFDFKIIITQAKTKTSNTVTCYRKEKQLLVRPTYFPSLSHKVVDWIFSAWWKSSILPGGRQRQMRGGFNAVNMLRLFPLSVYLFNVTITPSIHPSSPA